MWYKFRPRCVQVIRAVRRRGQPVFAAGRIAVDADRDRRQRSHRASARRTSSRGRTTSHVFERDGRAGGHANTVVHDGLALDTGFLVHNERNYPLLCRLFARARRRARTSRTCRSRSAAAAAGSSTPAGGRSRSRANAREPALPRAAVGDRPLAADGAAREDEYAVARPSTSTSTATRSGFRRHFLVPLTSALWSTAPGRALEFPAAYAIRFFDNHGMLGFGRFRWRTVTGGSRRYVDAIAARLGDRLRLGSGVRSIRRSPDGVELRIGDGGRALRPRRGRDARRRGARAARGSERRRAARARRLRLHGERDDPAHRLVASCRERRAARASWNYRLGRRRPADDHLPPEPAAGARAPSATTA